MRLFSVFVSACLAAGIASAGAPQQPQKPFNQNLKPNAATLIANTIPHIAGASIYCGGSPCNEYTVSGTAFGAARGSRRVLIDGVPCASYLRWTATSITVNGPTMFWDHTYRFVIDNGATDLSNVFETRFPIRWDGASPNPAHAGDLVTLNAWSAGGSQNGRVVLIGSTPMVVTSWTGSNAAAQITVRVPALSPGTYDITITNGGGRISIPLSLRII